MERLELRLTNRHQAWSAIQNQLFPFLKENLKAEREYILIVDTPQRTASQNRRYWGKGVLSQIAEQAKIGGRRYSSESWHEQFKRQFLGVIELPNGQVVGKSTTKLSKKAFSEFCDQVEAYAASELGVVFVDLPDHD